MIVLKIIAYILVCTPLILGIVMLIVGFSLDVRWKRIKKAGEHVKGVHKVFAIILTVLGVLLGIGLPAGILINAANMSMKFQEELKRVPDVVEVEGHRLDYEFEYGGIAYKCTYELRVPKERIGEAVPLFAVKYSESHNDNRFIDFLVGEQGYDIIYVLKNECGVDMCYCEGRVYVDQSKMDMVLDYYKNDAPLEFVIYHESLSDYPYEVDFDEDVYWYVKDYCRQTSEEPSWNSMSYESAVSYFTLRWYSEDHIYSGYYEFLMDEDANLLGGVAPTPYFARGRFIPQDSEEYAYIVAKGREAYDYAIEQKGGN